VVRDAAAVVEVNVVIIVGIRKDSSSSSEKRSMVVGDIYLTSIVGSSFHTVIDICLCLLSCTWRVIITR